MRWDRQRYSETVRPHLIFLGRMQFFNRQLNFHPFTKSWLALTPPRRFRNLKIKDNAASSERSMPVAQDKFSINFPS